MIDFSKMFDLPVLKPKAKDPVLFDLPISFDPYYENAYNSGTYELTDDGDAFSGRKQLGKVKKNVWRYAKSLGTSFELVPEKYYNNYLIRVHGIKDESLISPIQSGGQEYTYDCGRITTYPAMLPSTEYICTLVDKGDSFNIRLDGKKIGVFTGKREGQVETVRRMLHQGFHPTCQIEVDRYYCNLYLIMRRKKD